jgi:hypothetical protein
VVDIEDSLVSSLIIVTSIFIISAYYSTGYETLSKHLHDLGFSESVRVKC